MFKIGCWGSCYYARLEVAYHVNVLMLHDATFRRSHMPQPIARWNEGSFGIRKWKWEKGTIAWKKMRQNDFEDDLERKYEIEYMIEYMIEHMIEYIFI